jgi:Protein of unknown function (DUF1360)
LNSRIPFKRSLDDSRRRTADGLPPYQAYAAIVGVYVGGLGLAGLVARLFNRNPACQTGLDFAVLSAASFKAARTLAHDEVTSFLRDPFR